MESVGLRWYKCDFHLHTMSSKCYKNKELDTAEMWVQEIKKKELNCIAITDHNDYRGIDEIKNLCEKEDIIAFPGVELSCDSSKIHMLVLFDVTCGETRVQEFLNQVGIFSDALGESGNTCKGDIFNVCSKAQEMGAVVIAAHIDEFNGISEVSYGNMRKLLNRQYINAVQTVNNVYWTKYDQDKDIHALCSKLTEKYGKSISEEKAKEWYSAYKVVSEIGIPMLSFSDNPYSENSSKHGLVGIGKHYSWLKMDDMPKLESVRQALLSYDMRLKPDYLSINTPDINPELFIEAIEIQETLLNEKQLCLRFNSQMNTIIGGRGSGKSSIIRSIAGGLQSFTAEDLNTINIEQQSFYRKNGKLKGSQEKKGVFKEGSVITIYLKRIEENFKIEISKISSMEDQERRLYRWENNKWVEETNANYLDFFKVQIFTQKQIYELAMDSNSLLNIIDKDIEGLKQELDNRDTCLSKVIAKLLEIDDLRKSIDQEERINTEFKDIEDQISKYKESGISDALREKQLFENQAKLMEDYFTSKSVQVERLRALIEEVEKEAIVYQVIDDHEIDNLMRNDLQAFNQGLKRSKEIFDSLKSGDELLKKKIEGTEWYSNKEKANTSYIELSEKLQEEGVSFSRLDDLLEKRKTKLEEVEKIKSDKKKLDTFKSDWKTLYEKYVATLNGISERRREFIAYVIENDSNVKFEVLRNRNRKSFVDTLKMILQKEIQTVEEDIQKLADTFMGKKGIEKFRELMIQIQSGIDVTSCSAKTRSVIAQLPPESFARLISFLPEDELKVSYKPEKSKTYIPLSNASAGQKTTAILTFLLAYGKSPLLLDQPEDDLDNKLVYDLIVTRLKKSKTNRQIIIVTHNANIPVNGDSEYIISMESESDRISVKYEGTMDDEAIRQEICDVMEGTKGAFEMRAKKYHFNIIE